MGQDKARCADDGRSPLQAPQRRHGPFESGAEGILLAETVSAHLQRCTPLRRMRRLVDSCDNEAPGY